MSFNELNPYEQRDFSNIFSMSHLQRTSKCSPHLHVDLHVQSDNATMLTAADRQNRDEPREVHGSIQAFLWLHLCPFKNEHGNRMKKSIRKSTYTTQLFRE